MAKEVIHSGDISWWNGVGTTLCGLKIPKPERVWFSGGPTCPTCKALKKGKC